jgi:phage terminase large subunit-like protein
MMVGDGEQSPKVYTLAVDREQARLLYDALKAMAESSPDLAKRHIRDYKITHRTRGGKMAPLSKETKNKDGLNPSCAVIDEYHAHPTSDIYDVISSAKGQRAQSLLVIITTAGMDTESPCYREYLYCKDILTGKISGDKASQRYFVMLR